MAVTRHVSFYQGLRYQGGSAMISWMLHRITGIGILLLVGMHVSASFFTQQTGSNFATTLNTIYQSWILQIAVIFVVLYHALSGVRIALLSLFPQFLTFQKQSYWVQLAIFIPVYGLTVFAIIQHAINGG